jgi:squalene-associated FAD-dependent desaturase
VTDVPAHAAGSDAAGRPRIVVVGGGLAGLASARACADAGASVTLLEARSQLGGAAVSIRRGGLTVDTGQHVFLRCCTAYRGFLGRIGSSSLTVLQDRMDIPVLRAGSACAHLRRVALPAPLHLAPALARYPLLSPRERLRAAAAAWRLRRLSMTDPSLDEVTFGAWLSENGQSVRSISALWDLFVLAALNAPSAEASLGLVVTVFRKGLLDRADAADIGVSAVPLSQLHASPAAQALQRAGVDVHLRCRAQAIAAERTGVRAVVTRRGRLEADAVIVAVPHETIGPLLPEGALPDPTALERLGSSAIVNLHLVFDRRVMEVSFAAAVDSPVQWVFDRTQAAGLDRGQYLALSISGADSLLDWRPESLRERVLPSLTALLPAAREAALERFLVTRVPHATFRQGPGSASARPGPRTSIPGLFLAGAWTDAGWPATMEGAVRSGEAAARCALSALGMLKESPRVMQ